MIHVRNSFDNWFISTKWDEIVNAIEIAYLSKTKLDLHIFGVKVWDLREFTTREHDFIKGISKIPDKSYLVIK